MNRNTDHYEDLEYIKELFDRDDIRAPESLSEENILAMLPERVPEQAEEVNVRQEQSDNTDSGFTQVQPRKKSRAKKWMAAAACFMIALLGTAGLYNAATAPPDTVTANGELYTFNDQKEIRNLINSLDRSSGPFMTGRDYLVEDSEVMSEESASDGSTQGKALAGSSGAGGEGSAHSDTYLQVDEVDEADIVKTDGKYIYYVTDRREVVILSAKNGKTKKLSAIGSQGVENYVHDIFLKGDTLITVGTVYDGDSSESYSGVVTYDISDRSDPEMINVFRQTGSIVSSRMIGSYVYLVTSDYVYKEGRCVPVIYDGSKYEEMAPSDICCIPEPQQSSYIVLSAVDTSSGKNASRKTTAVFGASQEVYCNDSSLYCTASEWADGYGVEYTRIVKAGLDGLKVRFSATAKVPGYIDDQFSMDESNGYFRIATTSFRDNMEVNNLYVLDSKLRETGKVSGFARNESIRAVRYFGDKAYVITYEAIDPLFIIDLSDPTDPKIEGEVKIDGFSTLLVPAGDGKLLGIGHATGDNGYGGEYEAGLKLVLFDISDPSEPKVLDSKEFKDMSSPAQDTHKALTVNAEEGWYAVPYDIYHEEEVMTDDVEDAEDIDAEAETEEIPVPDTSGYETGVLVFGADTGITVYDQHKLGETYLFRSVYIGDYIYALDGEGNVSSFRFNK